MRLLQLIKLRLLTWFMRGDAAEDAKKRAEYERLAKEDSNAD